MRVGLLTVEYAQLHRCLAREYTMQMEDTANKSCCRKDSVSVWWPKVHNLAHPLFSVWIITALASGTPVFAKGLLWRRLPAPNTLGLAAAEADTVFIHSTKHWGEESIETSATVDHHRESEQCFLLNGHSLRTSQYRTQCNRPATPFYYSSIHERSNMSKCFTSDPDNVFACLYSESLAWMEASSQSCWFTTIFQSCLNPVMGAAV